MLSSAYRAMRLHVRRGRPKVAVVAVAAVGLGSTSSITASVIGLPLVVDAALEQPHLHEGQHHGDREQREREHGSLSWVLLLAQLVVDEVREDVGLLQWPTLSEQIDLTERLEREDRTDDDREKDGG